MKDLSEKTVAKIYDISGKMIEMVSLKNGWNALKNVFPKGNYILQIRK